jgi:SPOR domain
VNFYRWQWQPRARLAACELLFVPQPLDCKAIAAMFGLPADTPCRQAHETFASAPAAWNKQDGAARVVGVPIDLVPADTVQAKEAADYVVRLISTKTEAEARIAFEVLQIKYPGILGKHPPFISRVKLGDGAYYRAQVGPFANADQANALCDNLKAAGGQCIVQRTEGAQ